MSTQLTARTRAVVSGRSAGLCEVCGQARATEKSHRRPRGAGGTSLTERHLPAWVIDCCHNCHQGPRGIERHRVEALRMGWLLPPGADALDEPVWLVTPNGPGWWLLDNEGGMTWADDPGRAHPE